MVGKELQDRTKKLAVRIIKMTDRPVGKVSLQVIFKQIIRSSTSVAANYRAACSSKSKRDFIFKMKIVKEELDETVFWLELLEELHDSNGGLLESVKKEARELLAITVQSIKTSESNLPGK